MLAWISRLISKKDRNYEQRFDRALKRSKSWGLDSVGFGRTSERFLNERSLNVFQQVASEYLCQHHAEDISQQCFAVTLMLKSPLEHALGVPLAYTLGFVEYNGRNVFYSDTRNLKAMLKEGVPSPSLNLHAWLTLPSLEVIDTTFGTTYGVVNQVPEAVGRMCFIHPDDMTAGMQYHPQLVGEDYLKRIGAMRLVLMPS